MSKSKSNTSNTSKQSYKETYKESINKHSNVYRTGKFMKNLPPELKVILSVILSGAFGLLLTYTIGLPDSMTFISFMLFIGGILAIFFNTTITQD